MELLFSQQCVYQFLLQQLTWLPQRSHHQRNRECKHGILKFHIHHKDHTWHQLYRKCKLLRLIQLRHCPISTTPVLVKLQIVMKTHLHLVFYQPQHLHHFLLQRTWFLLQVQYLGCIEHRLATLELYVYQKSCTRHQILRQNVFLCLTFCPQNQLIKCIKN